jgi:hypothetical protein
MLRDSVRDATIEISGLHSECRMTGRRTEQARARLPPCRNYPKGLILGVEGGRHKNTRLGAEQIPRVLEKMVELVGIEPTTSSLRTMRSPS